MKCFFPLLLIFLFGANSMALGQAEPVRLSQEEQIVLLRNDADLIPLQDMTQRILVVSVGAQAAEAWEKSAARYTRVEKAFLPNRSEAAACEQVKWRMEGAEVVMIALTDLMGEGRRMAYSRQVLEFLREQASDPKVVICQFEHAERLGELFPDQTPKHLLWAHQNTPQQQDWAAQVIFGGMACRGKLPLVGGKYLPQGSGMELPGGLRLQYTQPEAAGLNGQQLMQELDSIIQLGLDSTAFPGCQLLVAKDGKVVVHKAYGHHTYARERAVQLTDLYDYASMTKVTGALPVLMQLTDEGKFDLDQPLKTYWPDYANSNKGDLLMRRILAHGAGLKPYISYYTYLKRKNGSFKWRTFSADSSARFPTRIGQNLYVHRSYPRRIYKAIRKLPQRENTDYVYSGLSFYLYPQIIENLTGNGYEDHCKAEIYQPLGAHTITYNAWRHYRLEQIVPTEDDDYFRQGLLHGFVHDEGAAMMGGVSSNAGLFSTANDLAKLFQMYLNGGEYGGKRYISAETMAEFTRYQFPEEGNRRGLGFDKPLLENPEDGYAAPSASGKSFGHSGYTGTFAWADPETGILLVFMSNRVHPTRDNRKLYSLSIRPAMHEAVYRAME